MKILKSVVLAAAIATTLAPALAEARGGRHGHGHHGHHGHRGGHGWGIGLAIGIPILAAAALAPRYYYYPPRVIAPTYYDPYAYPQQYYAPAYVEPQQYQQPGYPSSVPQQVPPQSQAPQQQQQAANAWYFCQGANAYYPYVRECPGGWQQVPVQPPR